MIRILSAGAALLAAAPAFAHVSLATADAVAGSTYRAVLQVPHGCDGAATTAIRVDIPQGLYGVKPMPKPGWTLATETGPYDTPVTQHGHEVTEGTTAVTWSGGDLPDAFYDEFVLRGSLGAGIADGTVLPFAVTQTCGDTSIAWSGTGDSDTPAPVVTVAATPAETPAEGAAVAGDLALSAAFARATLPGAPVGGAYVTITNTGTLDDKLITASSPAAHDASLHEMEMSGDVMKMTPVRGGLPIPAGGAVTMQPSGYHIMLNNLAEPLREGGRIDLTLTFERAGEVTLSIPVLATDAGGAAAQAHHH